jgi:lipopolysaccharide/colanic/teichoic acid biosynthesis glycosyltransferase
MEFNFLLNSAQRSKTFARYSIANHQAQDKTSYKHAGFYYIGKNSANIEKLVRVFKKGYASDSIENVKIELERSLLDKGAIPEIIFCETQFELVSIKRFCLFLNKHSVLSFIPIMLDTAGLTEKEVNSYKKNILADELVSLDKVDEESLYTKSQFLRKVKLRGSEEKTSATDVKIRIKNFDNQGITKRAFDIFISAIALILLSPVFLLIILAIRLESKGPAFYISKRAGRGYRIFNFYKFRTMQVGADKFIDEYYHLNQYRDVVKGPMFFKINNDPRVTKVGAFLRNTSLDELPQLINVFLGDMSLVGNRPLPLYEAATLTTDTCAQRFLAPAGITGLWQIKKRGKENMSAEERISLDIDYANKYNFMYDLWIMANTPSALLQKGNV